MSDGFDDYLKEKSKKYRKIEEIDFPSFKSPKEYMRFMSGNRSCTCVCEAKYPPRNAILIRPTEKADEIYELLVEAWRGGKFKFLSHGSCQQFIKTFEIKKELRGILKYASVSCIDNVDGSKLKAGDILITRHGDRGVGKPHLILEGKHE